MSLSLFAHWAWYDTSRDTLIWLLGLQIDGKLLEKTFWRKLHGKYVANHLFTGIEVKLQSTRICTDTQMCFQVSTAAHVCGVLDLLLKQHIPQRGFVCNEDIDFGSFMTTPFGKYYARGERSQ